MARFVVDTHALIWYLENNPRLGTNAAAAMDDSTNVLFLSVISLAEALWMVEHGRSAISSPESLLTDIMNDPRIEVVDLTELIVISASKLDAIGELHDRQIVATAIVLRGDGALELITRDRNITTSGLINTCW